MRGDFVTGSEKRLPKSLFKAARLAIIAAAGITLWDAAVTVIEGELAATKQERQRRKEELRYEMSSYIWGIVLAIALTLPAFGIVYWSWLKGFWLYVALGGFAFTQVVVHFRFFLRITPSQKMEDLQLILFSSLILLLMVGGTIWILNNLDSRMPQVYETAKSAKERGHSMQR